MRSDVNRNRIFAFVSALALVPAALAAQGASARGNQAAKALPLKRRPQPTSSAISAADLMSRLYLFADDSMMGREAGTIGALKGTAYIAAEVKRLGLRPAGDSGSYFQNVPVIARTLGPQTAVSANDQPVTAVTHYPPPPFR